MAQTALVGFSVVDSRTRSTVTAFGSTEAKSMTGAGTEVTSTGVAPCSDAGDTVSVATGAAPFATYCQQFLPPCGHT